MPLGARLPILDKILRTKTFEFGRFGIIGKTKIQILQMRKICHFKNAKDPIFHISFGSFKAHFWPLQDHPLVALIYNFQLGTDCPRNQSENRNKLIEVIR